MSNLNAKLVWQMKRTLMVLSLAITIILSQFVMTNTAFSKSKETIPIIIVTFDSDYDIDYWNNYLHKRVQQQFNKKNRNKKITFSADREARKQFKDYLRGKNIFTENDIIDNQYFIDFVSSSDYDKAIYLVVRDADAYYSHSNKVRIPYTHSAITFDRYNSQAYIEAFLVNKSELVKSVGFDKESSAISIPQAKCWAVIECIKPIRDALDPTLLEITKNK